MVYKIFQSARNTSQSAVKALSHNGGSLFAASQSGYSAANNPLSTFSHNRQQRANSRHGHDALKAFSTQVGSGSIAERVASSSAQDIHLDAYFSAWKKQATGEREWKQFQFPKTIGYHGTAAEESRLFGKEEASRPAPVRVQSSSAVDDVKKAEAAASEAVAIEDANRDIAATIAELHRAELARVAVQEVQEASGLVPESVVEELSVKDSATSKAPITEATSVSPSSALESDVFADRLSQLREIGRYAEIPAVFEAMLRKGLVPTAKAYNALITAAYHLPASRHQVVPKVLDVYSDMLRRGVLPNDGTYTLMLEIMAVRALELMGLKRELAENKLRYAAFQDADKFLFPSHEMEFEISADDDTLILASKIFKAAASGPENLVFAAETYRILLQAYADSGDVDQMLRVFSHMEKQGVVPVASAFAPMVRAFAKSGDLPSAVECYNEYKALAVEDNNGQFSLIGRADNEMHAAVVEGYLKCDNEAGADKFLSKIVSTLEPGSAELKIARATIASKAIVKNQVGNKQFASAMETIKQHGMEGVERESALKEICESAADRGQTQAAAEAFDAMSAKSQSASSPAMLVMHVRNNDIDAARKLWSVAMLNPRLGSALIAPGVLFTSALIHQGSAMEGLSHLRYLFSQIRTNETSQMTADRIDSSFAFIGMDMARKGTVLSGPATLSFVRAMIENRGPIPGLTEQLLAGVGPEAIGELNAADLELALQIQADVIQGGQVFDVAHGARFAQMVDVVLSRAMPLSPRTVEAIDSTIPSLAADRVDLVSRWNSRNSPVAPSVSSPAFAAQTSAVADSFDPYASNMDHRGSVLIVDEIDRHGARASSSLNEAMGRLRNIRRAGRHPRYIAYAKLIGAAAREGKTNLMNDVFAMAQQDMPLQAQYPVVRHGWISILDAMVAACLTTGNRTEAFSYHQQLLDIGAAPSANTFGLYITTLKESTKTFDEATEAVRIFKRAQAEGVEPSSFLYNALIGKLGKARRIDDCLFYFSEMRQLGIRPTSVTYGTIVNALCRVSDERFAMELFDEMESMPNYKPRPAPYNSMMQFFLTTKRDSAKVLEYYSRMLGRGIQPTMHTYKLLIDTYATLEPVNLPAAEGVLDLIRSTGQKPEPVHFASLIHAKGCALHDIQGARAIFDKILADRSVHAHACLYQALFESMTANHIPMQETSSLLADMRARRVEMTPYIANTLIHGWAGEGKLDEARKVYSDIGMSKREPSTYEAMTKAYLSVQDVEAARGVVREMLTRGYPAAVSGKVLELLGHASTNSEPSPSVPESAAVAVASTA